MRGNMFVPIDLLAPILPELLARGRSSAPPRPWLGMFTTEREGPLIVAGLAGGGPGARADVRRGDPPSRAYVNPLQQLEQGLFSGYAREDILDCLRGRIVSPAPIQRR